MAHEKLTINMTREWARAQANNEPDYGITSVGGLAQRMSDATSSNDSDKLRRTPTTTTTNSFRQSLGKFVELSRRRLRLTVEQLASEANIGLAELLAIERSEDSVPAPQTIQQLAKVLNVNEEPLMELAGLALPKASALTESAVRFAARFEPMQALSPAEEAALDWFVCELTKA